MWSGDATVTCCVSVECPGSSHFPHRYPPFYDENPIGIYQKILAGKLDIPRHVDAKARDMIKRFLTIDRTNRLGEACCLLIL